MTASMHGGNVLYPSKVWGICPGSHFGGGKYQRDKCPGGNVRLPVWRKFVTWGPPCYVNPSISNTSRPNSECVRIRGTGLYINRVIVCPTNRVLRGLFRIVILNIERIRENCRHEVVRVYCRGEFTVRKETYSVEPIDETLSGRHRVYKESDNLLSTQSCGT